MAPTTCSKRVELKIKAILHQDCCFRSLLMSTPCTLNLSSFSSSFLEPPSPPTSPAIYCSESSVAPWDSKGLHQIPAGLTGPWDLGPVYLPVCLPPSSMSICSTRTTLRLRPLSVHVLWASLPVHLLFPWPGAPFPPRTDRSPTTSQELPHQSIIHSVIQQEFSIFLPCARPEAGVWGINYSKLI